MLQTLDSVNPGASQFALLFKTQPRPADRLAQLDKALGAKFEALGARSSVEERFVATVHG